jgi:hypothetical protein
MKTIESDSRKKKSKVAQKEHLVILKKSIILFKNQVKIK